MVSHVTTYLWIRNLDNDLSEYSDLAVRIVLTVGRYLPSYTIQTMSGIFSLFRLSQVAGSNSDFVTDGTHKTDIFCFLGDCVHVRLVARRPRLPREWALVRIVLLCCAVDSPLFSLPSIGPWLFTSNLSEERANT